MCTGGGITELASAVLILLVLNMLPCAVCPAGRRVPPCGTHHMVHFNVPRICTAVQVGPRGWGMHALHACVVSICACACMRACMYVCRRLGGWTCCAEHAALAG